MPVTADPTPVLPDALGDFLTTVDQTQQALLDTFRRKREALAEGRLDDLQALAREEADLVGRLRELRQSRQSLLDRFAQRGIRAHSVSDLLTRIAPLATSDWTERLDRIRNTAMNIRHESWFQWVVCSRMLAHCRGLLEIVAHRGEQCPTYDRDSASGTGGAVLDQSI